jgi:hypothetical protein
MPQDLNETSSELLSKLPDNVKDMILSTIGSDTSGVDVNHFISLAFGLGQTVRMALFQGNLGNILGTIGKFLADLFVKDANPVTDAIANLLNFNHALPPEMVKSLDDALHQFGIFGPLMSVLWVAIGSVIALKDFMGLANTFIERNMRATFHTQEMDPRSLIRSVYVNPSTYAEVFKKLQTYGYPDADIDLMLRAEHSPLPVDSVRILYLKGEITLDYAKMRLHESGLTDARITELIESWLHVQTFGEYLQGVARGAHRADLDSIFGLSSDIPSDFINNAARTGVGGDDAIFAYRAHWTLPDPRTLLLMRERGMIGDDAYKLGLEYSGIPPALLEQMTQVNYTLLPLRVLVTAYHQGVMSDDQLMREIVSHGLGDERATIYYNYIKEASHAQKTTQTVARLIDAYKMHALTRDDVKGKLIELHYTESDAEFALIEEDFKEDLSVRKEREIAIQETYQSRLIEEGETRSRLTSLGYAATFVDALIERWKVKRDLIVALPSKSDLDKFLATNVIDETTYISYMEKLRYPMETILMYLDFKSTKKRQTTLLSQAKEAQKLAIAQMKECYTTGSCDDATVKGNLSNVGFDETVIDTLIVEWTPARNKAAAAAASAAAQSTGG